MRKDPIHDPERPGIRFLQIFNYSGSAVFDDIIERIYRSAAGRKQYVDFLKLYFVFFQISTLNVNVLLNLLQEKKQFPIILLTIEYILHRANNQFASLLCDHCHTMM